MKLWRYIQGYRKGKEAHDLEKEAMSDPFLAHALRGFDRVEGDHIKQIERLQEEIRLKNNRKVRYFRAAGIAASILLVIGLGAYFMVNETKVSDTLPVAFEQELQPMESAPIPSQPVIAQQKEIKSEQKVESPKVPKPAETEDIAVEESASFDALMAPAEKEMQHVVIEEPVAVSTDSTIAAEEEMGETVELNEVEIVGYQTQQKKSLTSAVATISASPTKNRRVRGKVTGEHGEPLIGVSVQVEGTNEGVITDLDGQFEITAADGSKLRASYIGYESLEKLVKQDSVMDFAMNEDKQTLDEVVVVGMGSKRQSVAKDPKPVDGMRKYKKYLKENLIRPADDECSGVKGKVVLRFYVGSNGRPQNITVSQSLCASADEEAIRLVENGPDWKQGENPVTLEVEF